MLISRVLTIIRRTGTPDPRGRSLYALLYRGAAGGKTHQQANGSHEYEEPFHRSASFPGLSAALGRLPAMCFTLEGVAFSISFREKARGVPSDYRKTKEILVHITN